MSAPAGRRNFVAAAAESVSFAVANHLTAAAVVLPFICLAFGGSAFAAALIFPTYTAANLLGVVIAPRVLGLRSVTRSLALILALIATVFAITAVGILLVSPVWLNALWVVAAVLGLLTGVASIAVVEVMSSVAGIVGEVGTRRRAEHGWRGPDPGDHGRPGGVLPGPQREGRTHRSPLDRNHRDARRSALTASHSPDRIRSGDQEQAGRHTHCVAVSTRSEEPLGSGVPDHPGALPLDRPGNELLQCPRRHLAWAEIRCPALHRRGHSDREPAVHRAVDVESTKGDDSRTCC